jgi:hypothetical protein
MKSDQIQNSPSYFIEKDLNISSFLMASEQMNFIKAERKSNGTVYFYFEPKDKAEILVAAYWSDQAPGIQPRKLFSAQRDLKNLIFSGGQHG